MKDNWIQPDGPLPLLEGEVHVWSVRLDLARSEPEGGRPGLSADERARAARFVIDEPRRVFAQTRSALRQILGGYLDRSGPSLRFALAPGGKPHLPGAPETRFNVSHSGDRALVAVARGAEIGVDIERASPDRDLDGLAGRFFHPVERAVVRDAAPAARAAVFYAIWSRKEALLKATGKGLRVPLSSFRVPHAPTPGLARLAWSAGETGGGSAELGGPWALWTLPAPPGFAAALCAPPSTQRVVLVQR